VVRIRALYTAPSLEASSEDGVSCRVVMGELQSTTVIWAIGLHTSRTFSLEIVMTKAPTVGSTPTKLVCTEEMWHHVSTRRAHDNA
jgi:hypothetical protein